MALRAVLLLLLVLTALISQHLSKDTSSQLGRVRRRLVADQGRYLDHAAKASPHTREREGSNQLIQRKYVAGIQNTLKPQNIPTQEEKALVFLAFPWCPPHLLQDMPLLQVPAGPGWQTTWETCGLTSTPTSHGQSSSSSPSPCWSCSSSAASRTCVHRPPSAVPFSGAGFLGPVLAGSPL